MAEYINNDSYQIGDTVIISRNTGKNIGKIEEIQQTEGTFTYTEFQAPGESQVPRQSHHGKFELIKSDIVCKEDLRSVLQKCFVYKLKEYIKLSREERTSKDNYVVRQFYEEERKILRPEILERECFDSIIVNPDDELIQCHCGKFYRVSCISEENSICDSCGIDMLSDQAIGSELEKRQKDPIFLDSMVPLKKLNSGFDFSSASNILSTMSNNNNMILNNQLDSRDNYGSKRIKLGSLSSNEKLKKVNELKKRVTDKANSQLDKFKQSMQLSRQIPEQERIRQKIRENFFFAVIYGFEEFRIRHEKKPNYFDVFDQEAIKKLLAMDVKSEIDFVKTITLAIEANLYHKYNRNVGKTSEYTSKSRTIVLNLKHERNFELRLKILLEDISPSEQAGMSEEELAPKSVHNERQQKQQEFFSAREITEQWKTIGKNHKDELDINDTEDQKFGPPVALTMANGDMHQSARVHYQNYQNVNEVNNEKSNIKENIIEETRGIDKDIQETMQGLEYSKFKQKCIERYEEYLPKEVAVELQACLN